MAGKQVIIISLLYEYKIYFMKKHLWFMSNVNLRQTVSSIGANSTDDKFHRCGANSIGANFTDAVPTRPVLTPLVPNPLMPNPSGVVPTQLVPSSLMPNPPMPITLLLKLVIPNIN